MRACFGASDQSRFRASPTQSPTSSPSPEWPLVDPCLRLRSSPSYLGWCCCLRRPVRLRPKRLPACNLCPPSLAAWIRFLPLKPTLMKASTLDLHGTWIPSAPLAAQARAGDITESIATLLVKSTKSICMPLPMPLYPSLPALLTFLCLFL